MFLARIVFFRLHESPRYLVHAGRPQEAIESLQMISRFNGSDLSLELEDVEDHRRPLVTSPIGDVGETLLHPSTQKHDTPQDPVPTTIFDAGAALDDNPRPSSTTQSNAEFLRPGNPTVVIDYHSTGESPTPLDSHSYATPADEHPPTIHSADEPAQDKKDSPAVNSVRSRSPSPAVPTHTRPRRPRPSLSLRQSHMSTASGRRTSSIYEKKVCHALPRWLRKPLWAWWDRVGMVLSPEWRRTTVLVWAAWCAMALGSVFVSYVLELNG